MKILVVEDHEDSREALKAVLLNDGHAVHAAKTGEEAIAIAEREDLDLAFLDIGLPDIDGRKVLKQLARRGRLCPCYIMTGWVNIGREMERDAKDPVLGVIAKPLTLEAISRCLNVAEYANGKRKERRGPKGAYKGTERRKQGKR